MFQFTKDNYRAAAAEFIAMVLFVFVGCGTAVSSQAFNDLSPGVANDLLLPISVAFGFGITVLVYGIAPISGGHINPAVSFAFAIVGKIPVDIMALYWVAQCFGAILGAAILWGCTNSDNFTDPPFNVGSNFVSSSLPVESAFLIELMGTFLLVFTVMMSAEHPKNIAANIAPIAIGWSVLLAHLVLIPFTGCGINPARSLGPHIVSILAGVKIGIDGWWVFYTAPFVGAGLAALFTKFVFGLDEVINDETAKDKVVDKSIVVDEPKAVP